MSYDDVTPEEYSRISQGLYAYCRGLDRFDRPLALSPFVGDAHLVYSEVFEGTPAQFMDWIWPIHTRMLLHVHRVANIFVERTSSGELVSESYVQVLLRSPRPDGSMIDSVGNGRYIDRWVDRDGRLLIAERDYVRDATRVQPYVPYDMSSVRPEAAAPELTWARDRSDASYRLLNG